MRGGNDEMISAGLEALDWLGTIQRCEIKGHFVPIGHMASIRGNGKGALRSTAGRSLRRRVGLLAGLSRYGKKQLEERGVVRLQLVPGR